MARIDSETTGNWYLVRYNGHKTRISNGDGNFISSTLYVVVRPYNVTSADTVLAEGDYEDMNRLAELAINARGD